MAPAISCGAGCEPCQLRAAAGDAGKLRGKLARTEHREFSLCAAQRHARVVFPDAGYEPMDCGEAHRSAAAVRTLQIVTTTADPRGRCVSRGTAPRRRKLGRHGILFTQATAWRAVRVPRRRSRSTHARLSLARPQAGKPLPAEV